MPILWRVCRTCFAWSSRMRASERGQCTAPARSWPGLTRAGGEGSWPSERQGPGDVPAAAVGGETNPDIFWPPGPDQESATPCPDQRCQHTEKEFWAFPTGGRRRPGHQVTSALVSTLIGGSDLGIQTVRPLWAGGNPVHGPGDRLLPPYQPDLMFWLTLNTLFGSYLALTRLSRS